jgi:hypothetical protein
MQTLECGGKRSATPLWILFEEQPFLYRNRDQPILRFHALSRLGL